MVVVTFKLHGKREKLVEISQSLKGIAEKVKKLEGCKDTKVYQDTDNDNILFLVEEWQKQRQLDDHMKSSLFSALLGVKGLLAKDPEVKFMTVDLRNNLPERRKSGRNRNRQPVLQTTQRKGYDYE